MSQPPSYSRSFSFTNFQAANPSTTLPGSSVDLELNNAKATLDAVLTNLALIQRDDGAIKNASVGLDQLKTEVPLGFNVPQVWLTGTAYTANSSTVFNGSGYYRCLITHTSGTFATDLAALKWQLIVNLAAVPLVAASQIAVTPSGLLTTDVQTSLQALDTGKAALSHTQLASTISDSTTAGRALLTAADATAQNVLLGTTLLGFSSGDVKETAALVLQSGWYWCDGSTKNRVTDASLFNAITIQQTGTLVSGSAIVTALSDTTNGSNTPMSPGMPVSGTGVQSGTVIQSVDSATQVTLSKTATVSGTAALVFAPYGVGDGTSSFGLPNRSYVGVGRDNASGSASNITQVSTTITTVSGSAFATVGSATGLFVGMGISTKNVPIGQVITAISGVSITLSAAATATAGPVAARFSPLVDAQTLGSVGGAISASTTLVTANLPAYTPAGTITNGVITFPNSVVTSTATGANLGITTGPSTTNAPLTAVLVPIQAASGFAGSPQGGTSTPIVKQTMQPTIVMNYIIKR